MWNNMRRGRTLVAIEMAYKFAAIGRQKQGRISIAYLLGLIYPDRFKSFYERQPPLN
jgi:hypothetical protein